jgi:cell division protein FtsI/penicillin-binding protein 2
MNDLSFGSVLRKKIVFFIMTVFFVILVVQLFSMQVINRIAYSEKAAENSVKPVFQPAPRGVFFDRFHRVLVGNKPSFTLRITPADYDKNLTPFIEAILNVSPDLLIKF